MPTFRVSFSLVKDQSEKAAKADFDDLMWEARIPPKPETVLLEAANRADIQNIVRDLSQKFLQIKYVFSVLRIEHAPEETALSVQAFLDKYLRQTAPA